MTETISFFAKPASSPRHGKYFSLRLRTRPGTPGTEFARLRMERDGWNVWCDDMDMQRWIMGEVFNVGRKAPLEEVLPAIRAAYYSWYEV